MPLGLFCKAISTAAVTSSVLERDKELRRVYYDDSIIFSVEFESHLEHLKTMLK